MKLLLDHNVNRHFASLLERHKVETAHSRGWDALDNGDLIRAAADGGFEVLITIDKRLRHERNLANLPLSVLELNVLSQRLDRLEALLPWMPEALDATRSHRFVSLRPDGAVERVAPIPGSRGGDE